MNFIDWFKSIFKSKEQYSLTEGTKNIESTSVSNENELKKIVSRKIGYPRETTINKSVITKMVDIVRNDMAKPYIRKQYPDGSIKRLELDYNNRTQSYSAILRKITKGQRDEVKEKYFLSLEEFIPYLKTPDFKDEILKIYNNRIVKEQKISDAKRFLLQDVENTEMTGNQKKAMINIIDRITQLSERVGYKNKVPLAVKNNSSIEVGLSDYLKEDSDDQKRLLKVKKTGFVDKSIFNQYKNLNVSEFIEYAKAENINLDEFAKDTEKRIER